MRKLILVTYIVALAQPMLAQQYSRQELENRRKQIMDEIKQTEEQLAMTKRSKSTTMGQLHALQNKLAERQRLIGNINDEISDINSSIQNSSTEIGRMRQNLDQLKMRYAQSIRFAYENQSSYNMLAFLFSSKNFNDALRRMRYLKKFRDYRKQQVEQIRTAQAQLQHKIGALNVEKAQKDELLSTQMQQKQVLQNETNETNQVVNDLKGKEKELMANVERNRKAARQLDKAISDIIRREIEAARKKAEEEERKRLAAAAANNPGTRSTGIKVTTTTINVPGGSGKSSEPSRTAPSYALSLTPEVTALSNNFQANMGRLPWPVEKGFISEPFGRHAHAVAEKVMVENDGVEIQTNPGAQARAVFDGTVTGVAYVPGMGQLVIVTHGNYFTAYSRITNIAVKKGDKVRMKQPLGTVMLNDDGSPALHFELWKVGSNDKASPVDPARWIAPLH